MLPNLANALTISRILIIPIILILIYMKGPLSGWTAFILFLSIIFYSRWNFFFEILNNKKTYFELKNNLINLRGARTYKDVAMDFIKILDLND